jgi:hypothetical protein
MFRSLMMFDFIPLATLTTSVFSISFLSLFLPLTPQPCWDRCRCASSARTGTPWRARRTIGCTASPRGRSSWRSTSRPSPAATGTARGPWRSSSHSFAESAAEAPKGARASQTGLYFLGGEGGKPAESQRAARIMTRFQNPELFFVQIYFLYIESLDVHRSMFSRIAVILLMRLRLTPISE